MIVSECKRCVRRQGNRCLAFTTPAQMWGTGPCWGYTQDHEQVLREMNDIVRYAHLCGGFDQRRRMQAELDLYRESVGA